MSGNRDEVQLDQVDSPVDLFLADGAYDVEPTSDLLAPRFGSMIKVTIPPPRNAVPSRHAAHGPTARDSHIADTTGQPADAWPGRKPPVTINAVGVKLSWAVERLLSDQS